MRPILIMLKENQYSRHIWVFYFFLFFCIYSLLRYFEVNIALSRFQQIVWLFCFPGLKIIQQIIGMSCCGTKKKVPPQTSTQNIASPLNQGQNIMRESGRVQVHQPVSKISFLANDYEPRPFEANNAFMSTQKAQHFVVDRPDRLEDYAQQSRVANQSKLLQSRDLLNYELDEVNGISYNYNVDTFHYESVLTHYFFHTNLENVFDKNSNNYAIYDEAIDPTTQQIKSTKYF